HRGCDRASVATADPLYRHRGKRRGLWRIQRTGLRERTGRGCRRRRARCRTGAMIRFDRVSKRYGSGNARDAVAQLSFEVGDGEMVLITGRSGAGKSTVLALMALLERATQGQIWVNGEHLNTLRTRAIPRFR